jgi:hypothetical protein
MAAVGGCCKLNLKPCTCSHVSEGVGHDPNRGENVYHIDGGRLKFRHVQNNVDQKDRVGEGRVDAAVQRHPPLLHKPGDPGRR